MSYLDIYKDQVILVTGGAGAIGSNLCRALAEAEAAKVVILDDLSASPCGMQKDLPRPRLLTHQ